MERDRTANKARAEAVGKVADKAAVKTVVASAASRATKAEALADKVAEASVTPASVVAASEIPARLQLPAQELAKGVRAHV